MSAQRPQPTAHEPEPGCSLDRRGFLQASAGAAAAIAMAGASSETASASSGLVEGVASAVAGAASDPKFAYGVAAFGPAGLTSLAAYHLLRDDVNKEPSADAAILHQLCQSEVQSLGAHEVTFQNRLNDARPVANLEARHGIASAWEDGDGSSTAYDRALQRIRQHYEAPEFNHLHVTNKSLLQLSYIAGAAQPLLESGEVYENMDGYMTSLADDSNGNSYQLRMTDQRQEQGWTLHDGTDITNVSDEEADDVLGDEYQAATLEAPIVEAYDTSDMSLAGSFPVISEDLFSTWDSSAETVTATLDDGTELTWDYTFVIPSHADADLESIRVFDGREFCKILDRIHSDSDTVTGNYSVSFVEDLYAELDAGNITPNQVRSPEGMVHFLSGTSDPSNERFRVSMLQQFGMEQPDFSMVSGMKVSWSGATDTVIETDPSVDDRLTHPADFVTDESYNGVLFGSELPTEGFTAGNTYAVGTALYTGSEDGEVHCIDPTDGTVQWRYTDLSVEVQDIAVNPDQQTVYISTADPELFAVDATDGSLKWTFEENIDSDINSIAVHPDGETIYVGDSSGLRALDAESTAEQWSMSYNAIQCMAVSPDGETLYTGEYDGPVRGHDLTDGASVIWSYGDFSADGNTPSPEAIDVSADGDTIIAGVLGGTVHAFDADGTHRWSHGDADAVDGAAISDPEGVVLFAEYAGNAYAVNLEDGTEEWSTSVDGTVRWSGITPDGSTYVVGFGTGESITLNASDGTDGDWTYDGHSDYMAAYASAASSLDVDGFASRALIFDDDAGGEIDLWHGTVQVEEMYDAGGATIEHVSDETITGLEESTGKDIETIVSEVDGYDSVEDIQYTRDVMTILEHYESEGTIDDAETEAENIETNDPDYERPEYDTFDSTEFAQQMNEIEEYIAQLEAEEEEEEGSDVGIDWPDNPFDGEGGAMLGVGLIGIVILAVVGFVMDLIPGLGN